MARVNAALCVVLLLGASTAAAKGLNQEYPSCDLTRQHAVKGELGGSITDPRQAHISVRANILQADIGTLRVARRLTQAQADAAWRRVETVRQGSNAFVRQQGFLSAAEVASYDRELDAIAESVCGR